MVGRHHDFARGELENGRPAAAVTALKQALALDPNRAAVHHDLGVAFEDLGRMHEAEVAYRDALRVDPLYTAVHCKLGELLQRGNRVEEALRCFESALSINPALNQSRLNLASALEDLGEFGKAAACYRDAVARSSAPAGIYMRLGVVLWKLGDSMGALEAFEQAVAVSPPCAEGYYNLGSAQLELGRFDEAVRSAREALRWAPAFSEAQTLCAASLAAAGDISAGAELLSGSAGRRYLLLATRLMSSRLFGPARRCLESALRAEPGEVMARHLLSALSGENPDHPAAGYVRQVFDTSAATFDRDLVTKLGYGIPGEMVHALRAVGGTSSDPWDVLDLGCGTGLVGLEISACSRSVAGIDVAPNMIERARHRQVYTDLRCADLMMALMQDGAQGVRYDVVTAADVFIYVGKLDAVIPAIRRVLRPGGLVAFSAEALEASGASAVVSAQDYGLGIMGRYAHGVEYLRRLAADNGFEIPLLRNTRIRFEHRRPVQGWLTVWRAV